MVSVGQIGCGYWGPNLLRIFSTRSDVDVKLVAELRQERIAYLRENFPAVSATNDYREILKSKDINAVVVATSGRTHYQLAKEVLASGKHCLVEKPLAMTEQECRGLCDLAAGRGLVLMVGHTVLYNAAVQMLKQLVVAGSAGEVYYIYAQRLNLGRIQQDINVIWSLAPHDISILLYVLGNEPVSVAAQAVSYIQEGIEDVAFLHLRFADNVTAHLHLSWLDPGKARRMVVVGSKKMIVYDDMAEAKIQIYDKGIDKKNLTASLGPFEDFGRFQLIQRAGDILFPKIDSIEPLKAEICHFVDCVLHNKRPVSDGLEGLAVTRVLEAAQASLSNNGREIFL